MKIENNRKITKITQCGVSELVIVVKEGEVVGAHGRDAVHIQFLLQT
jgi:hypothetical protein